MVTSRFRFSHDVLVHLKKGTDTSDLLNFNIDPPFWRKKMQNGNFLAFLALKCYFFVIFRPKCGININVKEI